MLFNLNKKRTPIFFVIHGLPMGGAEKFLISLINHMEKNMGNTVLILLGGECTLLDQVSKNVEVIVLRKRYKFDVGMIISLGMLYKKMKPSKVFCVNPYSFFISKLAAIGNRNISFYLSPHTTVAFSFKNDVLSRLFLSGFDKNDTVIFLCKYQMSYMRKRYLTDKGQSLIIYNGIDTNYYNPKKVSKQLIDASRKLLGLNKENIVILSVARISKEKGHDHAIEALQILHDTYSIKAHLVFVGDGESELVEKLKQMIEQKNMDNYVHFAGNQNDVRPYYMSCNLFTLASTSETFSLSALEALSFGKPCVLTEVGGAREMIESNKNGLLARSSDPNSLARAWNHILSRPGFTSTKIREEVEKKFDVKNMLNAYSNILCAERNKTFA
jgi:glycosyltransferase involved in cell wall biosynthesis